MDYTARIDDVVPAGTPGTVTMSVTGNVLSVPQPDQGESFASYAWRVHRQCHWPDNADVRGELMFDSTNICAAAGGWTADGRNWPEAADRFFNHEAYLTPAQKQELANAKEQWNKALQNIGNQASGQPAQSTTPGTRQHHGQGRHAGGGQGASSNAPAASPAPTPPATPASGTDIPISNES